MQFLLTTDYLLSYDKVNAPFDDFYCLQWRRRLQWFLAAHDSLARVRSSTFRSLYKRPEGISLARRRSLDLAKRTNRYGSRWCRCYSRPRGPDRCDPDVRRVRLQSRRRGRRRLHGVRRRQLCHAAAALPQPPRVRTPTATAAAAWGSRRPKGGAEARGLDAVHAANRAVLLEGRGGDAVLAHRSRGLGHGGAHNGRGLCSLVPWPVTLKQRTLRKV